MRYLKVFFACSLYLFERHNTYKRSRDSSSMDNYQKLVEKISSISGLSIEEIDRRVEGKRAKLSGLVSKEGAAQIVAAEQGINFDKERLKISELAQGMKRANVLGKVIEVLPVREYDKNGRQGKIGKLKIADESSTALVVFWDTNHISLIEEGKIINGSVIEISNGNVRNNEKRLLMGNVWFMGQLKLRKERY